MIAKETLEKIESETKGPKTFYEIACVAWRFWLGELSNKVGRGQRNREEIGAGAT